MYFNQKELQDYLYDGNPGYLVNWYKLSYNASVSFVSPFSEYTIEIGKLGYRHP